MDDLGESFVIETMFALSGGVGTLLLVWMAVNCPVLILIVIAARAYRRTG